MKERIDRLRREIDRHNRLYYVDNAPEISDRDFDFMLKELEALEREYPEYADPLSPTQRVGSDISKAFEQADHVRPMLSLSNTYSIEEVDQWVTQVRKALEGQDAVIDGEMKYDGTSISLIYSHGRLVRAVTRGDGTKGDVVTDNVKTIRSIPLVLEPGTGWPEEFEIRGEILLPWAEFERLNLERDLNGEAPFANPRNAASGTLKLQNPTEVAHRGLTAVFYYILADELPFDNHYDNLRMAAKWGFKTAPVLQRLHSITEVDEFITYWDSERKKLPVATDGLVFKIDSLRQQLNLGYTAKSPRWAIAYKFAAERALTPLRYVTFEVGRTGIITPVANLEPVLLSGTIVKRASLHNEDILRSLDIHTGDMVYVEKGGEIIPKITGVDISQRAPGAQPIQFATHCPSCGTPLQRAPGEAAWFCPNKSGCMPQVQGRIEHFAARKMMDIDGIGEETARQLCQSGLVRRPADLYSLTVQQLKSLEGFQDRSARHIIDGLEKSRQVPFDRVIYALGIPGVGATMSKKIARAVKSIDRLQSMTAPELYAIEDVGPIVADDIVAYLADPSNIANIEALRRAGLQFEIDEDSQAQQGSQLEGMSIVISGTFSHHSRDEYKAMIEAHGGKNVGSISKKTTAILAGDNMGPSKLEKAQKLGIPLWTENEFLALLRAGSTI